MKCLDDIFYEEFRVMMKQLKVRNGGVSLFPITDENGRAVKDDFYIPDSILSKTHIIKTHLVTLNNIGEEYYSKLNQSTNLYFTKVNLARRKFDYKGEFIKDKDGNYDLEHVTVPHDCITILSEVKIGVPTKFKPKESFDYVDVATITMGNTKKNYYMYIVPKKYCYYVNQTALIMTTSKFGENSEKGKFYAGEEIAMTNGITLFLYIIPYNPIRKYGYRVIATSTHPENLISLSKDIYAYWLKTGKAFNPAVCDVSGGTKGIENMAKRDIIGTIGLYSYAHDKALDNETDYEMEFGDVKWENSEDFSDGFSDDDFLDF